MCAGPMTYNRVAREAAEKCDANRVIRGKNGAGFRVTRSPRLLLMPTFCPLKYGIFDGIPVKDSGGATIEDFVVVGYPKNRNLRHGSCRKLHV